MVGRRVRGWAVAAGVIAAIGAGAPAAHAKVVRPAVGCGTLATADLGRLDTVILTAERAKRSGHGYCDVHGYISPQIAFEVLLPLRSWRGDYLQQGCGGFCGLASGSEGVSLTDPSRTSASQGPWAPLLGGRLVVAADDMGHVAKTNGDALWAKDDPRSRVVYGYESEHALARTAKALIRAFYRRGPAHAYFDGVSVGGREALQLAQRFPRDFDGIVAGAPAHNYAALFGELFAWQWKANVDARGRQILTAEKLPALHAAVQGACADAHGVIADPRACAFDPASLRCPAGADRADCLTSAQVDAARRLYRGPADGRGHALYDGGEPYGSELAWNGWLVAPAGTSPAPTGLLGPQLADNYLRYAAYWRNPAESFDLGGFRFTDAGYRRLARLGGLYGATDPDLGAFRARGGKLILYQGWADQALPPQATVNYAAAVVRRSGGFASTSRFMRLFMVPGLYHCACGTYGTGDPATRPQFMGALVRWVRTGAAPSSVSFAVQHQSAGQPLRSLTVTPTDPLMTPAANGGLNGPNDYVRRHRPYRSGMALWCRQRGPRTVCSHRRS